MDLQTFLRWVVTRDTCGPPTASRRWCWSGTGGRRAAAKPKPRSPPGAASNSPGRHAHDTATETHGGGGRDPCRRRHRHVVRAAGVQPEPALLLQPDAGPARARRRRAARFRVGGLVENGSVKRAAGQPRGQLRRSRTTSKKIAGELHRRAAGSVPRRAGHHRARQARRTASSSPRKCSRSTTRTTCRPRSRRA